MAWTLAFFSPQNSNPTPVPSSLFLGNIKDCIIKRIQLDLGSIRSSLRYGLSTLYLYRLTIRNMEDLHLVLPALNLSTLNAGILIMMQKVRLMMFSLNMVDYSMSFLLLST